MGGRIVELMQSKRYKNQQTHVIILSAAYAKCCSHWIIYAFWQSYNLVTKLNLVIFIRINSAGIFNQRKMGLVSSRGILTEKVRGFVIEHKCSEREFLMWCYEKEPGSEVTTKCNVGSESASLTAKIASAGWEDTPQKVSFEFKKDESSDSNFFSGDGLSSYEVDSMSEFCGTLLPPWATPSDTPYKKKIVMRYVWIGLAVLAVLVIIELIFWVCYFCWTSRAIMRYQPDTTYPRSPSYPPIGQYTPHPFMAYSPISGSPSTGQALPGSPVCSLASDKGRCSSKNTLKDHASLHVEHKHNINPGKPKS